MSKSGIRSTLEHTGDDWADRFAKRLGSFLRERRLTASDSPTQQDVGGRLEVDASWISRLEKGQFCLRSAEDVETYAVALGESPGDYLDYWHGLRNEWLGRLPWPERTVFAETFRRQGEKRADVAQALQQLASTELEPGIRLDVLIRAIRKDPAVREAVKAFCRLYDDGSSASADLPRSD